MNIKGIQALGDMSSEMIDSAILRRDDARRSAQNFRQQGYDQSAETWETVQAVLDGLLSDFSDIVRRAAEKAGQ